MLPKTLIHEDTYEDRVFRTTFSFPSPQHAYTPFTILHMTSHPFCHVQGFKHRNTVEGDVHFDQEVSRSREPGTHPPVRRGWLHILSLKWNWHILFPRPERALRLQTVCCCKESILKYRVVGRTAQYAMYRLGCSTLFSFARRAFLSHSYGIVIVIHQCFHSTLD